MESYPTSRLLSDLSSQYKFATSIRFSDQHRVWHPLKICCVQNKPLANSLSTSSFNSTNRSRPRLCLFYFTGMNIGSMLSAWHAISSDILHISECIQASMSRLAWRKFINSFDTLIPSYEPTFRTQILVNKDSQCNLHWCFPHFLLTLLPMIYTLVKATIVPKPGTLL